MDLDALKERFFRLWHFSDAKQVIWNDVIARYGEKHRFYHTLEHIGHCLTEFDIARKYLTLPRATDWAAIEHALWFHDIVYSTTSSGNEEKSAEYAYRELRGMDMPVLFCDQVKRLILVTKLHLPQAPDEEVMCDIDLAILGQPRLRFSQYEEYIKFEYGVEPHVFSAGRAKFLVGMLKRRPIFSTSLFQHAYELHARANMALSLHQCEIDVDMHENAA
ncbi:MAG: hypothetical protein KBC38_00110 [Candidatus Pacebacteria bacterium]|nr:hypothetical protein [Candidatus Paceibacterota bacterium]MBP9840406.1 hypothetical protein [Candidatus Paceibacterota bacterium]